MAASGGTDRSYLVVRDTREKAGQGWVFPARGDCRGTEVRKLDTGDYTVAGFESRFVIERKASTAELAANLFDPRFHRELDRLDAFDHPLVVLEFDAADVVRYPENSGIPRSRWRGLRVTGPLLLKRYVEARLAHPRVHWEFAGPHGAQVASSWFKRVVERYGRPQG